MARYCINQNCLHRQNHDYDQDCQSCGLSLLLQGRYYLSEPLQIGKADHTEVWALEDWGYYSNPALDIDEYDDLEGVDKIIKILKYANHDTIDLLRNEYQILADLKRKSPELRIPRVSRHLENSYFTCHGHHCLTMERLPGISLSSGLQAQSRLTDEALAVRWLRDLVNTLGVIHQHHIQHLDINPSNIILMPSGELGLIDFGLASYQSSRVVGNGTPGYGAPELTQGQFYPQSDFYALGCTFVQLLTGRKPNDLFAHGQLSRQWRQFIPQMSSQLASLMEALTAPAWSHRPRSTRVIKHRLDAIQFPGQSRWRQFAPALGIGLVLTGIVGATRAVGGLHAWELQVFDVLIRLQPEEGPDDQILIIKVTRENNNPREAPTLSDRTLTQLLQQLQQYEPVTIGLDIYRDFPTANPDLRTEMQRANLFGVCNVPDLEGGNPDSIAPPPEIPTQNLGFADVPIDGDGRLRRHLLRIGSGGAASPCPTYIDFSFLVALHYLATAHGVELDAPVSNQPLLLGKAVLNPLGTQTQSFWGLDRRLGPYQRTDLRGHQMLLNYRAGESPRQIAAAMTVDQVLQQRVIPDHLKHRIILIGVVGSRTSIDDYWHTPYSADAQDTIPGVFIQAHKVSQIINAALGHRPLLEPMPLGIEWLWTGLWSLTGGVIASYLGRSPRQSGGAALIALLLLGLTSYGLMGMGQLFPLVPALIGLGLTLMVAGGITWLIYVRTHD